MSDSKFVTGQSNERGMKKKSVLIIFIIGMILFIFFSIGAAVSIGQVDIPLKQTFQILIYKIANIQIGEVDQMLNESFVNIIWQIRFPRAIMSMFIGAGLAMCGVVMQASVQNPLADPYILGISSGGSLGATFAILIGFSVPGFLGQTGVAIWAFAGALGASLLVLTLAGIGGKMTSAKLVLAGMVINALCNAFSNFIVYFADNSEGIKTVTFWTMGSLASANWDKLPIIVICVTLSGIFFLTQTRVMNTMLLGDETAVTLGVNLNLYRRLYMLISALITGVMVASCGMIGFVGLIIPHLVRGLVGSDHKRLMPVSILTGSLFMIWTDVLARTIIPKSELPIGIITAMIGAPMFMYMLIKKGYGFGGK